MQKSVSSAVAIALAGLLASCGGVAEEVGRTTVVAPPALQALQNARYQALFLDSVTGAIITDPLKVSFKGAAKLRAADGVALNGTTISTADGSVFLDAEFSGSATDFTIEVADAANKGWVANAARVIGKAGATGDETVEVRLVNTNKAAAVNASTAPIAMAVATGTTTSTGALTAPVAAVTVPKTATTDGRQHRHDRRRLRGHPCRYRRQDRKPARWPPRARSPWPAPTTATRRPSRWPHSLAVLQPASTCRRTRPPSS
jgi:hypothetical protein